MTLWMCNVYYVFTFLAFIHWHVNSLTLFERESIIKLVFSIHRRACVHRKWCRRPSCPSLQNVASPHWNSDDWQGNGDAIHKSWWSPERTDVHVSNRSVGRVFFLVPYPNGFYIRIYIYVCVCLFTVFFSVDTTNLCCLALKPGVPFFAKPGSHESQGMILQVNCKKKCPLLQWYPLVIQHSHGKWPMYRWFTY